LTQKAAQQVEPRPTAGAADRSGIRKFCVDHVWAVTVAGIVTVAVELGVFAVAIAGGMSLMHAALAALASCVLWVALATPALAASGRTAMGALFRGGIVADASFVSLLVLWACCDEVTGLGALKIYTVLVALAVAGVAVTRLARTSAGRYIWAMLASTVLLGVLASPFWIGGPIRGAQRETAENLVAAAVYANPFYSATACLTETSRFVWHRSSVMYRITRIGDYASAPPMRWYPAVLVYLVAAGAMACVAVLAKAIRRGMSDRGLRRS